MSEAHEKTRIRQLEDAAAHWEHKYATARQYNRNLEERNQKLEAQNAALLDDVNQDEGYERLKARNAQLEAALRPVANHMVIDKDKELIGGCYAIDVVQTAKGLVGSVLEPLVRCYQCDPAEQGN